MAGEIQSPQTVDSDNGYYAVVRNSAGKVADDSGESFVTYNGANLDLYDIPLTEQGLSGVWVGDFPDWIAAGVYYVYVYRQVGESPEDGTDVLAGVTAGFYWSGSAVVNLGAITVSGTVDANVVQAGGNTGPITNFVKDYDGTGYDKANSKIGTATTIGATGLAAIWDRLTSAIATAGSIGKLLKDKLGLIVSPSVISGNTSGLVSRNETHTIFQGEARTAAFANNFIWSVDGTERDFTGGTVTMYLTRLDDVTGGDASATISGSITDAGTADQKVVVSMDADDTGSLALSPSTSLKDPGAPKFSYAYRFEVGVEVSGDETIVAEGRIIVKDKGAAA